MYRQEVLLFRTCRWGQLRSLHQTSTRITDDSQRSKEWAKAKPFNEIPGPTKFQLLRGLFPYGVFYNMSLFDVVLQARKMYGDLFLLPSLFGSGSSLVCFNENDFPIVLRSEGIWPKRRGLPTMTYFRTVHRKDDFGDIIGLLGSNGKAWGKLRTVVNPILMQPQNARLYLNKMLEVSNEFLQRIREIRDPETLEMPASFEDEINRLTFESVAVVALNQQIGLIRKDRDNEDAQKIFKGLRKILELSVDLDVKPSMWKIIKTPKFHEMIKNNDAVFDVIIKYINQAIKRIENNTTATSADKEESVLEKLLKIDKKVAIVMAMDMLMGGGDTTSATLVGILLCIAKNPEKQEKLRQEIRTVLPRKDSKLTVDNMKNLPYLRACIKEGMRIYPITLGTLRSNEEDIVLSGYQVPKDNFIVLSSNLLLMEEKFYPKPKEFIPERWIRDEKNDNPPMNPFLFTPFGFGARSCVGKRLVEMELEITVARLVRNFHLEFNYSTENAFKNLLINVPAIPLKFKLSEVEN